MVESLTKKPLLSTVFHAHAESMGVFCAGKFILTCYPSDLMNERLRRNADWSADFTGMSLSAGANFSRSD